jgi:hypothetical protein
MKHVHPLDMPVPPELQAEAARRFNQFADEGYFRAPFLCMCKLIANKKLKRHCCKWELNRTPFLDHVRGYRTPEGEHRIISQPYAKEEALDGVVSGARQFANEHGLSIVRISREASWHFPDWTILIEFRRDSQAIKEAA